MMALLREVRSCIKRVFDLIAKIFLSPLPELKNNIYNKTGEESTSATETYHPLTTTCGKDGNQMDELVGMDKSIKRLISFLKEDSEDSSFFTVYGGEGLGKTTLVQKAYNSPDVRHKFLGCAWITAPHHAQAKTLWQNIFSQIDLRRKDEIMQLSDLALVLSLKLSLQSKKYLIVLDDVSDDASLTEALLMAMPSGKMSSKVVITTRHGSKAAAEKIVEKRGHFLEVRPLTKDQSRELFLRTQLPRNRSDFETKVDLKEICSDVLKKCRGVPLVIKLLGHLMAGNHSVKDWEELYHQQISMSAEGLLDKKYSCLPNHLKRCLLYLALFPKDIDIEAEKLCNLWIAEEMITCQGDGNSTMLSTAETYLDELANKSLIQVKRDETALSTNIKSCRLPDFVRDYCSQKRKEESSSSGVSAEAFYFDKYVGGGDDFLLKPKKFSKVKSFLFLNTHEQDKHLLSPKSLVLKNFKQPRVLDFNWLDIRQVKFPKRIHNLAALRYLSFRYCYLKELSPSIGKLLDLEILDLRVNPEVDMSISNVISKLTNLRSLYFPYKFHANGNEKLQLDGLSKLENLKNFVPNHCWAKDLSRLKNLKYLTVTIWGNVDLEEIINCINKGNYKWSLIDLKNFDCYSQTRCSALLNLLGCKLLNALHVEGHIGKLSDKLSRPTCVELTEIFLIGSDLTEDPMPVLGNFPKLQKLGICNGAFLEDQMVCKESNFPQLKYLELSNLRKLKIWNLGEGAMLNLSTLTIENCQSLQALPDGLSNLQEFSIIKMPKTFTDRYEYEGIDFYKIQHVPSIKIM